MIVLGEIQKPFESSMNTCFESKCKRYKVIVTEGAFNFMHLKIDGVIVKSYNIEKNDVDYGKMLSFANRYFKG